ncbi:MAG: UDP-glucose 4-epimerase GalE [Alphaproteobacteria bacterium]|nr:UDP-glucose 4-epimerase GalE [Alphaproteobacteria bacterium]
MPTTVLVTGGAGYIGAHACLALHQAGFLPVTLDDFSAGQRSRVQWGPLVTADVRDAAAVNAAFAQYQPQAVLHFAGQISVPESVQQPLHAYTTNTLGTVNVLNAMAQHGCQTLVFSSTAAVYGIPTTVPIPETAPLAPINPYGQSKLMVERILADYAAANPTFRYAALRYFNAAGATPKASLGYQRPNPFHVVPMVLRATLGLADPLKVFGTDYPTPDGTAIRDYLHVTDLAHAHVLALQHLLTGQPNLTLNLGTSRGYSVAEVLATAATITGRPVPHTQAPRRAGDPPQLVADATQAATVLGWQPQHSSLANILATDWAWHQTLAA